MINITKVSLIQEVRAIHAISELKIKINIDVSDEHKFNLLKYHFDMNYSLGLQDGLDIFDVIEIDHSKPLTSIFSITKPLIFPKVITDYLKQRWPKSRKYEFGFSGLITSEREDVIEKWLLAANHRPSILKHETISFKIKRKLFLKLNIRKPLIKKFGKLFISSSNRGRIFPGKSWDDNYYNFLLRSKFILCPSGIYIWTYRFFESILCGAIPVVEKSAPCYNGFIYYKMDEELCNIKWSKEIIEYNYKLCISKFNT